MKTPYFKLQKKQVLEQYNNIRQIVDKVSYSAKTNYEVAKVLEETDSDFSVHSIKAVNSIKDKKRCLYFLQATTKKQLEQLIKSGVRKFVADNTQDINTIINFITQQKISIELFLRARLQERTLQTGKHFVYGIKKAELNKTIEKQSKNPLIKIGVHFHRKSQNISEWSLTEEIKQLIEEENMKKIFAINIGGGIPVEYKNYKANTKHIFEQIKKLKEYLTQKNILLIAEPGRYIAAPAITLHTTILLKYDNNIVVDCSVFNTAMDTFVINNRLLVKGELKQGTPYTIKGITPDSMDILRYKVFLDDPQVGDEIIFLNAGAYNYATDFCGLEKPPTIIE